LENIFEKEGRERLESLDIESIRIIAKALGITPASKKNKEQMIKEICSVCFADEKCDYIIKKDGKTPLKMVQEEDEDSFFKPNLNFNTQYLIGQDLETLKLTDYIKSNRKAPKVIYYEGMDTSLISMARASSPVSEYKIIKKGGKGKDAELDRDKDVLTHRIVKSYGYVDVIGEEWFILPVNGGEAYQISEEEIKRWGLELYDSVCFDAFLGRNDENYVININEVNDAKVGENKTRVKLDTTQKQKLIDKYEFEISSGLCALLSAVDDIKKGGRILVSTSENNGKKRIMLDILKGFREKDCKIFPIFYNASYEESILFQSMDSNATVISEKATPQEVVNKTATAFLRAQKYVEEGKDAVVVVGNMNEYFYNLNMFVGELMNYNLSKFIETAFQYSGKYEDCGSLTVVGVVGNEDKIFIERLKSIFNLYVPLKDADTSMYPRVDYRNVYSNNRVIF